MRNGNGRKRIAWRRSYGNWESILKRCESREFFWVVFDVIGEKILETIVAEALSVFISI